MGHHGGTTPLLALLFAHQHLPGAAAGEERNRTDGCILGPVQGDCRQQGRTCGGVSEVARRGIAQKSKRLQADPQGQIVPALDESRLQARRTENQFAQRSALIVGRLTCTFLMDWIVI
jgi:hypothetical protein